MKFGLSPFVGQIRMSFLGKIEFEVLGHGEDPSKSPTLSSKEGFTESIGIPTLKWGWKPSLAKKELVPIEE